MEQILARRSFCLANVILFFGFCTLVLAGCIGVTASTLLRVAVAHVVSLSFAPRCLQIALECLRHCCSILLLRTWYLCLLPLANRILEWLRRSCADELLMTFLVFCAFHFPSEFPVEFKIKLFVALAGARIWFWSRLWASELR